MPVTRSFIAIELAPDIRIRMSQVIDRLKRLVGSSVRWVPPENIHITLKFLGDVASSNIDLICSVLKSEALHHRGFDASFSGLGAFPSPNRPRVLWVGIQAPTALAALYHGVDKATTQLGYAGEDRPFSPHLTIGRVSQHATSQDLGLITHALETVAVDNLGTQPINAINLYRSDLSPQGAHYTVLCQIALQNHLM